MNPNKYYIVDYGDIHHPQYFNKAFENRTLAKEAIASYLGEGYYVIYKGSYLSLLDVPKRSAPFQKYKPKVLRGHRGRQNQFLKDKRSRIKGRGIIPHMFKELWEPLPKTQKERKRAFKQDKGYIHNRILKE